LIDGLFKFLYFEFSVTKWTVCRLLTIINSMRLVWSITPIELSSNSMITPVNKELERWQSDWQEDTYTKTYITHGYQLTHLSGIKLIGTIIVYNG